MNQMDVKRKRYTIVSNIIFIINILVLSNVTGEQGIGYLAGAFECFILIFLLTAYSLPEVMARMIRSRMQKGQGKNAHRVFKAVLLLCVLYSVLGSLVLLFGADFLMVKLFRVSYGAFTLRLLIPAYILSVFAQAYRGYFQGMGSAVPTGISLILEKIILFVTGLVFCFLFGSHGKKVSALLVNPEFRASFSAAGIAVGLDLAMLSAVLFLLFVYQTNKRNLKNNARETMRLSERMGELAYSVAAAMLPWAAYGLLARIPVLGGMALYQQGIVEDVKGGIGICGAFYGKYLAVVLLFAMAVKLPLVSMESAVLGAYRKEEFKSGREKLSWGIHFVIINGSFLAVMLAILGDSLMAGFFAGDSGQAGKLLLYGSSFVLFFLAGSFFGDILIGQGRMNTVLLSHFAGVLVFFLYGGVSSRMAHSGMEGIVIGLSLCWLVITGITGFGIMRFMKWEPEWVYLLLIPVGTSALTGILAVLLNKALSNLAGKGVSFLICFIMGMVCNFVLLLALRGLRREELAVIPGGRLLVRFAKIIRLL